MYGSISKDSAVFLERVRLASYLEDWTFSLANCEHLRKEWGTIITNNNLITDGPKIIRVHRLRFY